MELIEIARTGRGKMPNVGSILEKERVTFAKEPPTPVLVMALDPAVEISFSTGWESRLQRKCARLDARDIVRCIGLPRFRYMAAYCTQLPTRVALNVMCADVAWGTGGKLVTFLAGYGMLKSLELFEEGAKKLSGLAKLRLIDPGMPIRQVMLFELNALTGCRVQADDTDEVLSEEIRRFAPRDMDPPGHCKREYIRVMAKQPLMPGEVKPLRQYVEDFDWATDGGASMSGAEALKVVSGELEGKLKLTKRVLPYVLEAGHVLAAVEQVKGVTVVKGMSKLDEVQRYRAIFPYALYPTILKMWLSSHVGSDGNYPARGSVPIRLEWRTSLGNKGWAEILRHLRTLNITDRKCARTAMIRMVDFLTKYVKEVGPLPVDLSSEYAHVVLMAEDVNKFDRQIGLFYLDVYWGRVRSCVPPDIWARYATAPKAGAAGYFNIPLDEFILPPDMADSYTRIPRRKVYESTGDMPALVEAAMDMLVYNRGQLVSGTEETSKAGNSGSYGVGAVGAEMLDLLVPGCVLMLETRGDDKLSAVSGSSEAQSLALSLIWWIVSNAFLEMSGPKSRIKWGAGKSTEFLRVDYSSAGVRGYLNRALVWTLEARPLARVDKLAWCDKQVSGVPNLYTCMRRGASDEFEQLYYTAVYSALDRAKIPRNVLHIPAGCGGMGCGRPVCAVAKVEAGVEAIALVTSGWAADIALAKLAEFGCTPDEAVLVAQARANDLVKNIEDKAIRDNFYKTLPVVTRVEIPPFADQMMPISVPTTDGLSITGFGGGKDIVLRFQKASELAKVRSVSTRSLLPASDMARLMAVEKRLSFPRKLALQWLDGHVPGNETRLHPELTFLSSQVAASLLWRGKHSGAGWESDSAYYACAVARARADNFVGDAFALTHAF